MADYECFPLWKIEETQYSNIAPSDLPISRSLAEDLLLWADRYDQTLNRADPAASGFSSTAAEIEFEGDGLRLWHRLMEELGGAMEVSYFSEIEHRERWS